MLRWLFARLRRRREHVPRAELLLLALPQWPRSFARAVMFGDAEINGICAHCGADWMTVCRWVGCVPRMPTPGDGMPRR